MRNRLVLSAAATALAGHALFAADLVTPAQRDAAGRITAEGLKADIRFLSSDLLEGRGPASRGDALAEAYIQARLEALGLEPGAPGGGWIQKVPLVGIRPAYAGPASFSSPKGTATGALGENFVAVAGDQKAASKIENAEIVFVGYGIVAPEYAWDDYKGADLKGKVLLMMNNDPEGTPAEPNLFAGKTRLWYGRWDYKYLMAAKAGAAGAIVIHTIPSAGYGWQVVQTSWKGELFELPDDGSAARGDEDVGDGRSVEEARRARREGPRRAPGRRGDARVQAGSAGRDDVARVHERRDEKGIGQRDRRPPRNGSSARGRGRGLHGASRPPRREARGGSGRRQDLQRGPRQRVGSRGSPRDRGGVLRA